MGFILQTALMIFYVWEFKKENEVEKSEYGAEEEEAAQRVLPDMYP